MKPPWIGATVELEDEGFGTIIDITETCVGVRMEGKEWQNKVYYIPIHDLMEER